MLGTNESQAQGLSLERHGEEYAAMLERLRAGAPEASCLVMSPPDRGMRARGGRVASMPLIRRIVERQREVAASAGCGFFSTLALMGGVGGAERWRSQRPVLLGGDLTHPTGEGAEVIGSALVDALMEGYEGR